MAFLDPVTAIRSFGLAEGLKVADFGVGPGHFAFAAAEAVGKNGMVYAVDLQKELLAKVKNEAIKRDLNIEVLWGDLEKEGGSHIKEGLIDLVVATNILFQLSERPTFLREAKRVLHSKGRLILIDWSDSFGGLGPQAGDVVTATHARKLAEEAGFVYDKDIPGGDHHWGMILRKP